MVKTTYINLYGGPGTGKSTTAAGLFYKLKHEGYNAELIQEYAKDRVWSEDYKVLELQPYILGKQLNRQFKLMNKVEVAITDSPILLSLIYKGFGCVEGFDEVVRKQFDLFDNLNIFLKRNSEDHPYNPEGRYQNEEEAIILDSQIQELLDELGIEYHVVTLDKNDMYLQEIIQLFKDHQNRSLPRDSNGDVVKAGYYLMHKKSDPDFEKLVEVSKCTDGIVRAFTTDGACNDYGPIEDLKFTFTRWYKQSHFVTQEDLDAYHSCTWCRGTGWQCAENHDGSYTEFECQACDAYEKQNKR